MELLKYFYHPDHLGSSSWITDGSGQAIQHLHYLPFGEDWVDQRNSSWNSPYTFSGKEKDIETGYGYFGARYYDSGLSIWLSVDPMSDKYPSMSPYNYCANNPVILVDPDGRDYETVIDEIAGTITIKAVYYTKNSNRERVQSAINVWNDQSGKNEVTLGEGENKKTYTINFELSLAEGSYENDNDASSATPNDKKSNFFMINDIECDKRKADGLCDGVNIYVKADATIRTDSHEVGHSLGIGEGFGLMETGGYMNNIKTSHIGAILNKAGLPVITMAPTSRNSIGFTMKNYNYFQGFGEVKGKQK